MKNTSFSKNLLREIKNSKSRFLSIFVIVAIGVAFFAGVRATSPDMILTCDKYLKENNLSDLTILSTTGFISSDIEKVKNLKGCFGEIDNFNFSVALGS